MLKEQYEKHNLEMQPYRHYLAEYQAMQPEYISSHLELPFDGFGRSFRVRFMEREYSVSHPDFFIRCLDGEEGIAVLCRDIHAKILLLRYLTEGDRMQATGNLLSYRDLPWGEVYYRQFYGRCILRLARSFGNRLEEFRGIMEGLKGIPRNTGMFPMNLNLWKACGCALYSGRATRNFPLPPRFSFPTTSLWPMPRRTRPISGMWCWII